MEHLLQLSGVGGVRSNTRTHPLAEQLGGAPMDLVAFDLKQSLHQRDIQMGIATALLRVQSDVNRRTAEIMKA